jgi:Tol biopolymer transport system component
MFYREFAWLSKLLILLTVVLVATILPQNALRRNGKIAFTSDRDGNAEIYVMNADGTNHVRLTNTPLVDTQPSWSPDGTIIAFVGQKPDESFAIFTMTADGTHRTEVTSIYNTEWATGTNPRWSPDGRKIAFHDFGPSSMDIFVVDSDGSNRQNLTSNHDHSDLFPTWSPDGSKILFNRYGIYEPNSYSGTMLHTINADGTNLTRLTNGFANGWNEDFPDWSASRNKIVYNVNVWDFGNDFYIANPDGTGRQFFHSCGSWSVPTFSPNGRQVIFTCGDAEIFARDTDGTEVRQLTNTTGRNFAPSWQPLRAINVADFDGDGRSDVSVFRPSSGIWYIDRSSEGFTAAQFGFASDALTPADFDGDGKTDISIFRDGTWWTLGSSDLIVRAYQFGQAGDIPVPSDYTGDGRDEIAVYRNGEWWSDDLSNGHWSFSYWGTPTDRPVVADYDGDGHADPAVYRDGTWHLLRSTLGPGAGQFGLPNDTPVPADYDGDGKTDLAVFRNGTWYVLRSTNGFTAFTWGVGTDVPVPADYDGDGKSDAAIFRDGQWWMLGSTSGVVFQPFGQAADRPLQAAFLH